MSIKPCLTLAAAFALAASTSKVWLNAAPTTPQNTSATSRLTSPVHSVTFHYDNARLGWNARETRLTPSTVQHGSFGKLWHQPLDGFVHGSPLQVSQIGIGGQSRDVVYAATGQNSVYALDAATGKILWKRIQLVPPISEAEFMGGWGRNVHGILSTPVIDLKSGTLYVCALTSLGLRQQFLVWALDIRTGKTRTGWPLKVRAQDNGTPFVPGQVMQRGALTLADNWLYIPFGGRGDTPPWRGWIIGINTQQPKATQRAFCTSPISDGAGVWSAGGVATNNKGELYIVTGNGDFDLFRGGYNLGQTVLRLRAQDNRLIFSRQKTDYFTPSNYKHLDDQDEDMGGATAIALPPLPGSSTPNLLFTGGKDGLIYLLNRDRLGGIDGQIQKTRLYGDAKAIYNEGIRATPAYYDAGKAGRFLFVAGDQPGPQKQLGLTALRLGTQKPNGPAQVKQVWTLPRELHRPTSPVVTSRGQSNAIVWTVDTRQEPNSILYAFDALTGRELYHSNMAPTTERLQGARNFISPTVVNGRVFIGAKGIYCYGLTGKAATPYVEPTPTATPTATATAESSATATPTPTATVTPTPTPEPMTFLEGTIVSLRGNILVIRPTLRPKPTRAAFDDRTEILSYQRVDKKRLKPGQRIGMGGSYTEKDGVTIRWIEFSDKPVSYLQEPSDGLTINKEQGWASGRGILKSVEPFVFTDDKGKEHTFPLDKLRGVWHAQKGDRNTLLIGTRVSLSGKAAPDGVIAAKNIYPDRGAAPSGTMFGTVLSIQGHRLRVRPRYTNDIIDVSIVPGCRLMRQTAVDADSIKVGQALTFWGEQRRPRPDEPVSTDLRALALLVGPLRYPTPTGDDAPKYFSGTLQSLRPVKLKLSNGQSLKVLPTAQMMIARLSSIQSRDIKKGASTMFVLSRRSDGRFAASHIIVDAPPWVGYGG